MLKDVLFVTMDDISRGSTGLPVIKNLKQEPYQVAMEARLVILVDGQSWFVLKDTNGFCCEKACGNLETLGQLLNVMQGGI